MSIILAVALLFFQAPTGSIEGVVFKSATSDPLAKSVIELRSVEGRAAEPYTTTTASDGKFAFRNLQPGKYRLTAARPGYVQMEYPSLITVATGQKITDVRFAMTPTGAIYGRVYDHAGQPIASATVQALKFTYPEGQRRLKSIQTAITNDLGEYRLFWLPPGSYVVSALPTDLERPGHMLTSGTDPRSDAADDNPANFGLGFRGIGTGVPMTHDLSAPAREAGETYVPTYFPGTTDPDAATAIDVAPGASFGSADLTLMPAFKRHIRGIIVNGITGRPNPGAILRRARAAALDACAAGGVNLDCTYEVVDFDNATFDAEATSGTYLLYAMLNDQTAQQMIEVKDADVDNIVLTLQPGITLTGRVTPPIANLELKLAPGPPDAERRPAAGASLRDGRFSIPGITPGDYVIAVSGLKGAYLKSITLGSSDVLNRGLHLTEKPGATLEVGLGTNPGTIEGHADVNVTVVLIPDTAQSSRADLYRNVQTDSQGRYRFEDLAPGDYKLFAWRQIEPGAWRNRDFMRAYQDLGKTIHVVQDSRQTVDATVIEPQ